ncbi:hypothetical protein AWU82_27980 [Pseudomonas glycinae]|uniref:Uncharacterized protein n=1 Tax=Pseudomonas glycinae TaxID=1785145 RepID=A0ABM6QHB3_9PSED|nr:hypothetical protein AWU82_27980 [Pseudomonas glycinae]
MKCSNPGAKRSSRRGSFDQLSIVALERKGGTRSLPRYVLARIGSKLLVPPTPSSVNIQASLLAMRVCQ